MQSSAVIIDVGAKKIVHETATLCLKPTHTQTHTHITHTHTRHLNHIVSNVASGGGPTPGLERTKEHLKIEVVIQMTRACSSAGRSAGSSRWPANRGSARRPASWSQPMGNTVWKYGTTCIHDLKVLEGRIRVPKISCMILPPRGGRITPAHTRSRTHLF